MGKEETEEELILKFAEFSVKYPQRAFVLIAGLFVGMLENSVKDQGGDEIQEIIERASVNGYINQFKIRDR